MDGGWHPCLPGAGRLLHSDELRVRAARLRQQLLVRSLLDQLALLHHADVLRAADCGEAVRDDNGGAAGHEPLECALDEPFALRVQGRGRLVEEEHLGVLEDGPGDCHALLLPARQLHPALADGGLVAGRELQDEGVGVRRLGGTPDLRLGGARPAVGDVLVDGRGEQGGLLGDEPDLAPEPLEVELAKGDAVEADAPGQGVVVPLHERYDRGLPAARLTNQGHGLAGPRGEGDPIEHLGLRPRRVREFDAAQGDLARNGLDRPAALVQIDARRAVDDGKEPRPCDPPVLEGDDAGVGLADGEAADEGREEDGHHRPAVVLPRADPPRGVPQRERVGAEHEQLEGAEAEADGRALPDAHPLGDAEAALVRRLRRGLRVEGVDGADRGEGRLRDAVGLRVGGLGLARGVAHHLEQERNGSTKERHDCEHHEGDVPAKPERDDDPAQKHGNTEDEGADLLSHSSLDCHCVLVHLCQQRPCACLSIKETDVLAQDRP
mmetsp:Transcript_10713/g.25405  ORF Transcript_10713/g.25405 Transcript_10713/m.25405 type:complete len:494 (-) Transcript_10713:604-2085(-)